MEQRRHLLKKHHYRELCSNSATVSQKLHVPSELKSLTESYSRSWHLVQNGQRLTRIKSELGLPQFAVEAPGDVLLIHDGSVRRGWVSLHVIVLLTYILFALPSGRRKREISERELA